MRWKLSQDQVSMARTAAFRTTPEGDGAQSCSAGSRLPTAHAASVVSAHSPKVLNR